jgi:hypothetical protein
MLRQVDNPGRSRNTTAASSGKAKGYVMTINDKEFNNWFAKAKPGESITYYSGKSFVADREKEYALNKLCDAILGVGFEVSVLQSKIHWADKGTLCLVQRRVGPRPEGNAVGTFEYIAVKRGGQA